MSSSFSYRNEPLGEKFFLRKLGNFVELMTAQLPMIEPIGTNQEFQRSELDENRIKPSNEEIIFELSLTSNFVDQIHSRWKFVEDRRIMQFCRAGKTAQTWIIRCSTKVRNEEIFEPEEETEVPVPM